MYYKGTRFERRSSRALNSASSSGRRGRSCWRYRSSRFTPSVPANRSSAFSRALWKLLSPSQPAVHPTSSITVQRFSVTWASGDRGRVGRGGGRAASGRALGLRGQLERLQQVAQVAVQHLRQRVRGEADAVVGDAALGEVVGADLGRAVAGAHLQPAVARALGLGLGDAQVEEARAQHLEGLVLVLVLALLVLAGDDQAGGEVRDAHGRV